MHKKYAKNHGTPDIPNCHLPTLSLVEPLDET